MKPNVFSTYGLPAREQFDAFRAWFDPVFDFEVEDPRQFVATSEVWPLRNFALGIMQAPALRVTRTASLIRRNPVNHWGIAVGQQQRACAARGTEFDVPGGVAFVTTLGEEIDSVRPADRSLQLYLPRDQFRDLAPVLDSAIGRPLDDAMGRLLAEFLRLLSRNVAGLSQADLPHLQDAVRGMVLACIAPSAEHHELAAAQVALTRRETIIRLVEANLENPSLDVAFICRRAGMSRSQIYRIMEECGGIAHYIQKRRLRRAYAEVSKFSNLNSIATIAQSLAFNDASSFSRSFKREFGMTPCRGPQKCPSSPKPRHRRRWPRAGGGTSQVAQRPVANSRMRPATADFGTHCQVNGIHGRITAFSALVNVEPPTRIHAIEWRRQTSGRNIKRAIEG